MQVNMLEAKNTLSRLVAAVERGEDVVLARNGKPVARIAPYEAPRVKPPGAWKGKAKASPGWDSPETNAEVTKLIEESAMRGV
ncbi:MAG: type II toxin-antitoxin system prevent-host-death family antitoxin [Azoarcus sp.]|jgi:prevent-host-death family protein|nr:type II toxin-antitoxin system prevent-host-death family antitoxin [Azoarcus sp.]